MLSVKSSRFKLEAQYVINPYYAMPFFLIGWEHLPSLIGKPVLSNAKASGACLHKAADRRFSYCELPTLYESLNSSG
jgi:hypothetical protein